MAAVDYFLKIDGLSFADGSAVVFEVLSFSIGVTQTVDSASSGATGAGAGRAGKSTPQDLVIVKRIDKASPLLFNAGASGKMLRGATLSLVPAVQLQGGDSTGELIGLLYKFTLSDVLVETVSYNGNELGDSVPLEQVTLDFDKIQSSFGDGSVVTGYDFTKQRAL